MTDTSNELDTTRCPLCGEANECAIAAGRDPSSCWCMSAVMDAGALARIPAEAQGRVCICARCAAGDGA
ncbi:MAG: cysteine-rich CWC family protein [Myxococcota bacterium]